MSTRVVRLRARQPREGARDEKTIFLPAVKPVAASFQDLFLQHYSQIRSTCQGFRHRGFAAIAIDEVGVAGTLCMRSKGSEPNTAIIGRHSIADLFLDRDPGLSLRHLTLVVDETQRAELRLRVLDLRTSCAFEDEHGHEREALVAEGPVFIRCGRYAVFCLTTGDGIDWPEQAIDGWECIPERIYLEESDAEPDRWARMKQRRKARSESRQDPRSTLVQTMSGPRRARRRLLGHDEKPLGDVQIRTPRGSHALAIGPKAARDGVLFGRYHRCDSDGLAGLDVAGISRVHLLLLSLGGRLHAIDTASTNGTWLDDTEEIRCTPLEPNSMLVLGEALATLRWVPSGGS